MHAVSSDAKRSQGDWGLIYKNPSAIPGGVGRFLKNNFLLLPFVYLRVPNSFRVFPDAIPGRVEVALPDWNGVPECLV
jgi:hypothetical protein